MWYSVFIVIFLCSKTTGKNINSVIESSSKLIKPEKRSKYGNKHLNSEKLSILRTEDHSLDSKTTTEEVLKELTHGVKDDYAKNIFDQLKRSATFDDRPRRSWGATVDQKTARLESLTPRREANGGPWRKDFIAPEGLWGKDSSYPPGLWGKDSLHISKEDNNLQPGSLKKDYLYISEEDSNHPPGLWGKDSDLQQGLRTDVADQPPQGMWGQEDSKLKADNIALDFTNRGNGYPPGIWGKRESRQDIRFPPCNPFSNPPCYPFHRRSKRESKTSTQKDKQLELLPPWNRPAGLWGKKEIKEELTNDNKATKNEFS